jgi:hypothetical protein
MMLFLFLASLSLADPLPGQPDSCGQFASTPPAAGQAPQKTAADGFHYVQDCALGRNWEKVETNPDMQKLLHAFGKTVGQILPVYSCFRNQQSQDEILCRNHCGPRFGKQVCEGRVAANLSEHTVGIAADVIVQTRQGPQSSKVQLRDEAFRMCNLLDQNRKQNNNGWGGITVYGVEPKDGKAYMHMDVKQDWCNWGSCQDMPNLGEGNCKRTKYRTTEAAVMQKLADAQKVRAAGDVAGLTQRLAQLRAPCQPGDTQCRDLFQSP